jgi:SAM-dependent methyltransferase
MRLEFPATARNRDPLLRELRELLAPPVRRVLEVASGSGEHAAYFGGAMPWLRWQPSDVEPAHLASIGAWCADVPNVATALRFDVAEDPWPEGPWDAVFCANLVHIAPWEVAEALLRGAARALAPRGLLVTYGPYRLDGRHTAPSNEAFDATLRERDPRWGVRDVDALANVTDRLRLERKIAMPANNFTLVFRAVA